MKLPSSMRGWFISKNHPDKLLSKFVQTGEQRFLIALIAHFNRAIFHYLLTQSDPSTAEDILQNTWLRIISKSSQFQIGSSAKYWVFAIARNALIDELRRQKRWNVKEIAETDIISSTLTQQLSDEEIIDCFNLAIKNLPFYQREAFIFQQEGFSLQQIATLTLEPQETIKSRLRYAKQTLKIELEKNS